MTLTPTWLTYPNVPEDIAWIVLDTVTPKEFYNLSNQRYFRYRKNIHKLVHRRPLKLQLHK